MSSPIAMSPAFSTAVLPHGLPTALKSCILPPLTSQSRIKRTRRASTTTVRCDVATKSADSVNAEEADLSEEELEAKAKVGSLIRVTAPLKVYHVNRIPEVDLEGMEGKLKDYVAVWKGKRISANLPYKVEFFKEVEGRGPVKFVAHLKEDEFEFIDT
ncbi:unnamed protein product [Eruca vesicaria subsp. sativa]|uniref:Ferredoxin thioredoxin reductase alpha chain domain-containing protein n=1 Tax=Eruca vesicaria subsp. sativa TaxID=29727 RepID=A0ABC8J2S0_ERUVS|nr:unnamed protein product [Eruca vesicaria subsp. sativa]